jgi:two-component system, response regulator, stage 0 sporulation protein A
MMGGIIVRSVSVLLLDNVTSFGNLLVSEIAKRSDMEIIGVCNSGNEGIEKIIEQKPDLVIMDLILPDLDGIGVLEKLKKINLVKRPSIIVATALGEDSLVRKVMEYGVDFYFVKPFEMDFMIQRILGLFLDKTREINNAKEYGSDKLRHRIFVKDYHKPSFENENQFDWLDDDQKQIEIETVNLLYEAGIPPHMAGYRYLREAIVCRVQREFTENFTAKEVYGEVANRFSTTMQKVERCIRNSIDKAWARKNHDAMDSLLGYGGINSKNKPTNAEFIAMMIERVRAVRKF